jgi:signal transduction histidine kinase
VTVDGTWLNVNGRFSEIVDRPLAEIRATSLTRVLRTDSAGLASAIRRGGSVESQITRRDGRRTRIRTGISPVSDPMTDRVGSLLLVAQEIASTEETEARRDAVGSGQEAGRLIEALEAERSHIARELHDDIGQSLALLVMQLWRRDKPVSRRRHADIPDLTSQVQSIAARVSRLSHELHSSSLEFCGLQKAIRGACGEFSDGYRVPVSFACQEIPAELDGRVALCLLRIVQEALQNVAKHSRATRIDVVLTHGPDDALTLTVVDDGVGFDVAEARPSKGIGLINMRERVRFIGGTFALSSAPGAGTRIEARVPVRPMAA